jgi:dienelactone hydrolase
VEFEMYLASPPVHASQVKGAVLVVHDIFGPRSGRHTTICDALAKDGFYAACPDLFGDSEKRASANLLPRWPPKQLRNIIDLLCCCKVGYLTRALKRSWERHIAPVLQAAMEEVQAEHAVRLEVDCAIWRQGFDDDPDDEVALKWGAVGFCWGALPVARLLSAAPAPSITSPVVGCGMAFHPSFRGKEAAEMVGAVRRPMMLCPCGDDPADVQPGGALAAALAGVFERDAAHGAFTDSFEANRPFGSMKHGFMTRGPLEDGEIAAAYLEGVELMRRYFTAHIRT